MMSLGSGRFGSVEPLKVTASKGSACQLGRRTVLPSTLALPLSFYVLTRACAVEGAAPAPPKHLVIVKGMVHVQLRLLPYIALLLTAATYGPTHARACLLGIVAALLVESALRIKRWPIPPICRTPFLPYLRM